MSEVAGTRAERKERTRAAILAAALALSEESGLGSISLRQVAREVGIVPTAFYRHFDSIEQLGLALVGESFGSLRAMIRDVRQGNPSLGGWIRGSVLTLVEHLHSQRGHFRFLVRERFSGLPAVGEAINDELELFTRELAVDLARIPGPSGWSQQDLMTLSHLIVTVMVSTTEALLTVPAGRPALEEPLVQRAEQQLRMIIVGAVNWKSSETSGDANSG